MDINPITPLNSGTLATMGGYRYGLPSLSQPSFLAQAPFDAFLNAITNPAAIARAAITRQTARVVSAGSTSTPALAAVTSAVDVATPPAPILEAGDATADEASAPVDFTQGATTIPAAPPGGAAAQTTPSEADPAPAANIASLAANALYEADAASQLAQGSGSLATDAAAKFMGAGQQPNQTAGLAAYEEALKAIPAVNGMAPSPALAGNTSSPQGKPFTHIAQQLAPLVKVLKALSSSALDIIV
jgi:hypothetical protein